MTKEEAKYIPKGTKVVFTNGSIGTVEDHDTLEEPVSEGLEEEISRYLRVECSSDDEPSVSEIARHFAQWGAEHLADARKMLPEDLEASE